MHEPPPGAARRRASPGAEVTARLRPILVRYYALGADKQMYDDIAAAAQQYGDERAAAAIEAERRRCAINCPTARALPAQALAGWSVTP